MAVFAAIAGTTASLIFAEHFPVKTYTVADGLLRDSVYKIKQDAQGFLWFCTPEGISRFDGYRFTNFTTDDGLPDRHVNDFLQTRDGTIYLATDGGLARLNPTGVRGSSDSPVFTVFRPEGPALHKFQVLLEDIESRVFCGTSNGLYIFAGNEFERLPLGNATQGPEISDLISASDGTVWVASAGSGLFYSSERGSVEFESVDELSGTNIPSIFQTPDGELWAGLRPGRRGGLCRLSLADRHPRLDRCYTSLDGLPSDWVTDVLEDKNDRLWIATTRGLCAWQGEGKQSVCRNYKSENELCDLDVWSLFDDKDSNLWVGSRCGLKELSGSGFTYFTEQDGLGHGIINSIFENASGDLFASVTTDKGRIISRYDGVKFSAFSPRLSEPVAYFGWGWKQTVLQDSSGSWWIPTGSGLFRSPPASDVRSLESIAAKRVDFPFKASEIFRVYEDSFSNIWVATTGLTSELWHWDRKGNSWNDYTADIGIGPGRIATAFVEEPGGTIWIGTGSDSGDTALIRYRDGKFRVFTKADSDLIGNWIRDLYVDDNHRLWVADTASSLLRIDDTKPDKLDITRYSTTNGLSSNGVYCVTGDAFGRIYAGTGRGLDRLDPTSGFVENFTTFDGLPDSTVEECYRDKQNVLWFGTGRGLARFAPEAGRTRLSPTLLVTGLRVNGAARSISILGERNIPRIDLDASQRSITVDFVGLGATLGERLRYEYRLNDSEWAPTNERTLNFADLRSGGYTLAVRATTRDAIVSDAPATVTFSIASPVWQRWWFILLALSLVALAMYVIYRSRVGKLLELERTRTRIATDLHDDIGSNLSKIALLSELVRMKLTNGSEENRKMLATIADVSRSTVESMRDIVWSINPHRDSVLEMTRRMREHAEDALVPQGVAVHFDTGESNMDNAVSMDVRRELFLIFKEAVSNTARHSECNSVDIRFAASGGRITMDVTDNGVGFDASSPPQSNGLSNMRARAERIGADFEITSEPGSGTTVSVLLGNSGAA